MNVLQDCKQNLVPIYCGNNPTKEKQVENRSSKNIRTLAIYARLCGGRAINKTEEAERFGVDARSIRRDIDDIRAFLDERSTGHTPDGRTIEYDPTVRYWQ